jgi:hypothetical protein
MESPLAPPAQTSMPDWLLIATIGVSIMLALVAAAMMFVRTRPMPEDEQGQQPRRYIDPVLLISAAGVILLALAAWILR